MIFSSLIFLFLFLPVTLAGYYLLRGSARNYWLLITSIVFFAWGGVTLTLLLLLSITCNYFFGLQIGKRRDSGSGYTWLCTGVFVNLAALAIFKYANFFTHGLNSVLGKFGGSVFETSIILPVGISFYTFHSLSYLVDIYRGKATAQKNIFKLALYISMFSQLVAGPIIRYSDVWLQLSNRAHDLSRFVSGVERFVLGLSRKVLLANVFAVVADKVFSQDPSQLSAATAWLGIICYTLQIYHDFAGYSDMAIGLGRMFGFEFMENFNFPYVAHNVKEFWRRWHISLSTFFRDYVYIPLGGNRVGAGRQYVNLIAVFFLTGLWHGASWTFVIWGLFHGMFLLIERIFLERVMLRLPRFIGVTYTLMVVMLAWVLFRMPAFDDAVSYWRALARFELQEGQFEMFMSLMNNELYVALVIGIAGALGLFSRVGQTLRRMRGGNALARTCAGVADVVIPVSCGLAILLCSLYLIGGSYNPFIYYRF